MRSKIIYPALLASVFGTGSVFAADPQIPFWTGRPINQASQQTPDKSSNDKNKVQNSTQTVSDSKEKEPDDKSAAKPPENQEPEWLRRMDKDERTTLTGGWGLQNMSGGKEALTSAGNRDGYYSPNTYQGAQFMQWNNVATRQDIPSWNGTTQNYPSGMWSQGSISPNTYYGPAAQSWGNMSSFNASPNVVSGGWNMSPWR